MQGLQLGDGLEAEFLLGGRGGVVLALEPPVHPPVHPLAHGLGVVVRAGPALDKEAAVGVGEDPVVALGDIGHLRAGVGREEVEDLRDLLEFVVNAGGGPVLGDGEHEGGARGDLGDELLLVGVGERAKGAEVAEAGHRMRVERAAVVGGVDGDSGASDPVVGRGEVHGLQTAAGGAGDADPGLVHLREGLEHVDRAHVVVEPDAAHGEAEVEVVKVLELHDQGDVAAVG